MKKQIYLIVICLLFLAIGCDFNAIDALPMENAEQSSNRYLYVKNGWQLDKEGDYLKLWWNPFFEINKEGTRISYISADGTSLTIDKNGFSFILHDDDPKAEFEDGRIILTFRDFCFEFIKINNSLQ